MAHGLVIITGGARGIGAAISRKLAADGYAIAVNFASDERAAEATVAAIRAAGGKAQAFRAESASPSRFRGFSRKRRLRSVRSRASSTTPASAGPPCGSTSGTRLSS